MPKWRRIASTLTDLVFPQGCPACDRTLSPDQEVWCPDCMEALLAAAASGHCPRCGMPVGAHLVDPRGCGACRGEPTALDGMACVGSYDGTIGALVRKYKYGRTQRLDRPLGSLLAATVQGRPWAEDIDALVPVPTSWGSRLQYGFRPAALLAARVARELLVPSLPLLCVRGKERRQVDLPQSERARNVRGAFRLQRSARVTGAALCIVDDVCTSGATLREVARVLKQAGAARVYAATLAKTDPSEALVLGA